MRRVRFCAEATDAVPRTSKTKKSRQNIRGETIFIRQVPSTRLQKSIGKCSSSATLSICSPLILVSRRGLVIEGKVWDSRKTVPVHLNVAGVAIHKSAHIRGVEILSRRLRTMPASSRAAGDFTVQGRLRRIGDGGKRDVGHAVVVRFTITLRAVEPVTGELSQREGIEQIA